MRNAASRSRNFPASLLVALVATVSLMPLAAWQGSTNAPTTAPSAPAQTFDIDDTHSMALFRVRHMGAGAFWGLFNDLSGTVDFVPGASLALNVEIKTDSVDSNNEKLDRHLKSPDFFNTKEFPTMSFRSTGSKPDGENRFLVTGDLTMRGITKSITVPVECLGVADMGMGARGGFEATFDLKRSEFGVSYGAEKGAISDSTRVVVAIEGVARTPGK